MIFIELFYYNISVIPICNTFDHRSVLDFVRLYVPSHENNVLLGTVLTFRPHPHHPLCVPTMTPGILIRTNLNMHYLRMLLHNLQLFWSVCFVLRRTCFVLMVLMATTGLLQCLVSHVTFPVFLLGSK